jgi:hypothetical protein
MNDLTDTRGKYIYYIELDLGDSFDWSYRVAGNSIDDALEAIKIDYHRVYDELMAIVDYTVLDTVRADECDPQTQDWSE